MYVETFWDEVSFIQHHSIIGLTFPLKVDGSHSNEPMNNAIAKLDFNCTFVLLQAFETKAAMLEL